MQNALLAGLGKEGIIYCIFTCRYHKPQAYRIVVMTPSLRFLREVATLLFPPDRPD